MIFQSRSLKNSLNLAYCSYFPCQERVGGYGGAKGSRTPDLLNAIQALSQLSYGPEFMYYHRAHIVFLQVLFVSTLLEQRSQVQPTALCLLLERGKF